jgi:hypothetical protein
MTACGCSHARAMTGGYSGRSPAYAFAIVSRLTGLYVMVSVLKSCALATALAVGISNLADAAARQRGRTITASGTNGAYPQYPTTAPTTAGGGYSADPHTRYLEMLADKYRPGW